MNNLPSYQMHKVAPFTLPRIPPEVPWVCLFVIFLSDTLSRTFSSVYEYMLILFTSLLLGWLIASLCCFLHWLYHEYMPNKMRDGVVDIAVGMEDFPSNDLSLYFRYFQLNVRLAQLSLLRFFPFPQKVTPYWKCLKEISKMTAYHSGQEPTYVRRLIGMARQCLEKNG